MKELVKMDEKGRIQIPTKFRKLFGLRPKDVLQMELKDNTLLLKRVTGIDVTKDEVLYDITHPGRSKVRVTKELLDKMDDELWSS